MKLINKIFSPTFLIFSLFLILYTFYKSEIVWSAEKRNYYLIYYIFSFSLLLFSIITFFLNKKIKEYLIIILISIFIGLYLFEAYLISQEIISKKQITKNKFKIHQLYKKDTGKEYDKRSKLEIYEDLKQSNDNIKIAILPNYYLPKKNKIFPLSGISNAKTILCNENGYYAIYDSDRYGFNNPDKEWEQNEIEYLIVGDSFAHGMCVNRPNDIGSVLRKLSNKSVINIGYSGNGPLIEYATLREYLDTNVKKVLWLYYERNDLSNLQSELKNEFLINYLNDLNFTQNLKSKQDQINKLANRLLILQKETKTKEDKFFFKLIKFIKIYNLRILIFPQSKINPQIPEKEFKKILKLVKELTLKNNSELYFVYLPSYVRYLNNNINNKEYELIKKMANELSIPFIDIHNEVFEIEKDPLNLFPFRSHGHYKPEGYRIVTESIFNKTK